MKTIASVVITKANLGVISLARCFQSFITWCLFVCLGDINRCRVVGSALYLMGDYGGGYGEKL